MIRRGFLAIMLVAAHASAEPSGDAHTDVAAANSAVAELRYDDAVRLLDQAWRRGQSSAAELRALFALAAISAGSMGDGDAAHLWFGRWLYLEPSAELPAGTSPKLRVLLDEARSALSGATLSARATRNGRVVDIVVGGDPLGLVNAARAGSVRVPMEKGTATVDTTADEVDLTDRYGNVLATLVVGASPATTVIAEPTRVAPGRPPWFERWTTWAVATGGLAAIGGGALVVAVDARSSISDLNRNSANHEFSETRSLQVRFDRAQLVAQIAIGGAAITAALGAWMWLRDRPEPVTITPTTGGAVMMWSVVF